MDLSTLARASVTKFTLPLLSCAGALRRLKTIVPFAMGGKPCSIFMYSRR